MPLTEKTKDELVEFLAEQRLSNMFGDGMERDYVMDGVEIVGLNQLSDEDLVEEFSTYEDLEDGELTELMAAVKKEMET